MQNNLAIRFTNETFKPAGGFVEESFTSQEKLTEEQTVKQINQSKLAKEWYKERLYVAASYCRCTKVFEGFKWYNENEDLKKISFQEFEFIYACFDNINEKFANSSYCAYEKKMIHEYIHEKGVGDIKNWVRKAYVDKNIFTKGIRPEIKDLFQNPYYVMTFDTFKMDRFIKMVNKKNGDSKLGRHRKKIDMIDISTYCQKLGFNFAEVSKDMNCSYEYNLAKWGREIASGFRQMRFNKEEVPACTRKVSEKSDKQKAKEEAKLEAIREEYHQNGKLKDLNNYTWLRKRGIDVKSL